MAARNKPLHPIRIEQMREKIKATLLIKRLEEHIVTDAEDPLYQKRLMNPDQVRAALGLLSKRLPDLKAVELSGDADAPLNVVSRVELVALK